MYFLYPDIIEVYDFDSFGLEFDYSIEIGINPYTGYSDNALDITKKDDYLYVVTFYGDLAVVDISDKANPKVSFYNFDFHHTVSDIVTFSDKAFVTTGSSLLELDISNPDSVEVIKNTQMFGYAHNIKKINEQLAVISSSNKLFLVDFSDTDAPEIVSSLDIEKEFHSLDADITKVVASEYTGSKVRSYQINQKPIAEDAAFSVNEDNVLNSILAISDREKDPFTIAISQPAAHGDLTVEDDGRFTYTPSENYFGEDSFTIEVTGKYGKTSSAQITLSVNPVNDAPSITASDLELNEDEVGNGQAQASDLENDAVTFLLESQAYHGEVTVNADGSFQYVPNENYSGGDRFTLIANDGTDNSRPLTVNITVHPVNDAPEVTTDSLSATEDTLLKSSLTATDPEGDKVSFALVSAPDKGELSLSSEGQVTYTPETNFHGDVSFTVKASDGKLESNTKTVVIQLAPVNDIPVVSVDPLIVINEEC